MAIRARFRASSSFSFASFAVLASMACHVDADGLGAPPGSGGSGTDGMGAAETGIDSTGDGGDEGGGSADSGLGCGPTQAPPAEIFDAVREDDGTVVQPLVTQLNWEDACPDISVNAVLGEENGLYVYRPGDGMGEWPEDTTFPLVLFMHGNGGSIVSLTGEHTNPFLDELAREGFVVIAATGGTTPAQRMTVLRCAAEWALTVWEGRERLDHCSVGAIGHSQGGGAVHNLALADDPTLEGLRALVGIAPLAALAAEPPNPPAPYTLPIPAERAVAYLVLQGPDDEDVTDHGLTNYDRMAPEDTEPVAGADKVMLLPYDARHWVFGGRAYAETLALPGYTQVAVDRGRAIARAYIPAFMRWKLYGEPSQRRWFVDPSHYLADADVFPEAIAGPAVLEDFWEDLYTDPAIDVLGARPVILSMFSQGTDGGGSRQVIDTLYREMGPATCNDAGHEAALAPAELLGDLDEGDICIGMASGGSRHESHLLRLDWGAVDLEDGIRWPIAADVSGYAYFGVRAGKRQVGGTQEPQEPYTIAVEIQTEGVDDLGQPLPPARIVYDRLIRGSFMNHTFRIPLADFCEIGIDPMQLTSVSLLADDLQGGGISWLEIDSLELTDHPGDAAARCPGQMGFWRCEATQQLVATETACDTVPVSGQCPSGHATSTPVDLPLVEEDGGFSGWIAFTPQGWIEDLDAPTTAELDQLARRCQTACEQEYSGTPHLSATCDAGGAFATPTRIVVDGSGPRQAIPEHYRDGSGVWMEESLPCSLIDSCCSAFEVDVCPAAPRRVTMAQSQLRRGEDWIVEVAGTLTLTSPEDETDVDVAIAGTVGFSLCPQGNENSACPVHVGHVHLEATESESLDVECGGQWLQLPLSAFEMQLVQPAFGIDLEDSSWIGFPPGALVFESQITSGPVVVRTIEPNQEIVFYEMVQGWLKGQGTGGSVVLVDVPCAGETKQIKSWFTVEATGALHGPPTVSIDMPSTVTCGASVNLVASAADPQGDHEPTRWEIDGVLLDASVGSIQVNQTHTLRAIVRDSRGATTVDTHSIECSSP